MDAEKYSTVQNQFPEYTPEVIAQICINIREQMSEYDYEQFLKYFRPTTETERKISAALLPPKPLPQKSPSRALKARQVKSTNISVPIALTPAEQESILDEIRPMVSENTSTLQTNATRAANTATESKKTVQPVKDSQKDMPFSKQEPPKELLRDDFRKKKLSVRSFISKTSPKKNRAAVISRPPRPLQKIREPALAESQPNSSAPAPSPSEKRASRSKNPSHDKFFRPHLTKKRHVVCILCETDIWPPNRETHLKKCQKQSFDKVQ